MIPVEKKSMTEIDRKNMLKRYSKIERNSSSERPMNSKPPRKSPKSPTQKTTLQNTIIESRSREPDRSEATVLRVSHQRSRRKRGRSEAAVTGGKLNPAGFGDGEAHGSVPASSGGDRPACTPGDGLPSASRTALRAARDAAAGPRSSSSVPTASIRPRSTIPIRSASSSAIASRWVDIKHRAPGSGLRDEQVLDDPGASRVETDQRLVDHQDLGIVNQRRRKDHPLFHPLRVVLAQLVDVVAHLEGLDQLVDPLGRLAAAPARTSPRRT